MPNSIHLKRLVSEPKERKKQFESCQIIFWEKRLVIEYPSLSARLVHRSLERDRKQLNYKVDKKKKWTLLESTRKLLQFESYPMLNEIMGINVIGHRLSSHDIVTSSFDNVTI